MSPGVDVSGEMSTSLFFDEDPRQLSLAEQVLAGRAAGKRAKLADEVGLVGIAGSNSRWRTPARYMATAFVQADC